MNEPETILVVDDEALLRMNMRAFLEDLGFHVVEASEGQGAIEACAREGPQLILLDISMPEMDGFEVCRRLKADPVTAEVPVIFVSALLNTADKVTAFACGGVDYVTKPFQFEEVEARVRAHLEVHRQRRQLKEKHEALCRLEELRDSLTHMIAHDMRSPLSAITGYLDLIAMDLEEVGKPELKTYVGRSRQTIQAIVEMINQMLDLSRLESGKMPLDRSVCDVARIAREVQATFNSYSRTPRIRLSTLETATACCDPGLVERILKNMVGNALKVISVAGSVEIRVLRQGAVVKAMVIDDGPGIAPGNLQRIFEKFHQVEGPHQPGGAGLGLAFCKLAVQAQGGEIGAESELGKGCTFWFTLPAEAEACDGPCEG